MGKTKKVVRKRGAESFRDRAWNAIAKFRAPRWLQAAFPYIVVAVVIFLVGGGFYCVVVRPPLIIVLESILVMILYAVAVFGFIIIKKAPYMLYRHTTACPASMRRSSRDLATVLLHYTYLHHYTTTHLNLL